LISDQTNSKEKQMANKFVDLVGGSDANNGSTFALRKKTLSSAAAVAAAGDVIRVMGKPSTSSSTATWTKGSPLVTLAAAMNQLHLWRRRLDSCCQRHGYRQHHGPDTQAG
jgi:ABC-type hemin transport system substrate-binding protein